VCHIVYDGVKRAAYRRAFTKADAEDFLQEGMLAVCEAVVKYKGKGVDELVRICSVSAYNRIASYQTRLITKGKKFCRVVDGMWYGEELIDEYEHKEFLAVLRSRLSILGARILDEKVNPEMSVDIMEMMREDKQRRKDAGENVLYHKSDRVTDTHVALALDVSKASVSRENSVIKDTILDMMETED